MKTASGKWLTTLLLLFLPYANSNAGTPLPDFYIAQNKGLTAGMGFGTRSYTACKTLWTWTGYGQYSYNSVLSGGASIMFLGGNLDSVYNFIDQKYSLNAKFTYNNPKYVFAIAPVFSFKNTSLSALRNEFSHIGANEKAQTEEISTSTECEDLLEKAGSSVGYQSGIGFLITPSWGLNFGHNLDMTFKGALTPSFNGSIAFNLRELFEKLIENTENLWISLEYSISFIEKNHNTHDIILGLAVGF
ncbi:MAG: hypothetical protein LBC64_05560 [Fibromonadaceae bacterium]|nr:hypothetical protein [Fibromonadaceae bacterium]